MTRETKIGLLVGLAFIIVIGILLSDHLTSSIEPPQAALGTSGNNVRQGVGTPGASGANAPITVITPVVTPLQRVSTQDEVITPTPAVQIVRVSGPDSAGPQSAREAAPQPVDNTGSSKTKPDTGAAAASNDAPVITPIPATPAPTDSELSKVAAAHGEELVSADGKQPAAGSAQTYTAQPGDSLSKIAAKFYGTGIKANRDLIVKANPSLAANENMIIAGKTYHIPAAGATAAGQPQAPAAPIATADNTTAGTTTPVDDTSAKTASATQDMPSKAATDAGYVYTVKPGDNLTRIARDEIGDVHAIAAIQELNPDKLKGTNHDVVIAGSKLRLPGKPLARAE